MKKLKLEMKDKELEVVNSNKEHQQETVALFLLEISVSKLLNQLYNKHSLHMEIYKELELLKIKKVIQEDSDI